MSALYRQCLGEERIARQYLFGDLVRAGARLSGGSDGSVSTQNPMVAMEHAVRRARATQPDAPMFLPEQRVSLDVMMQATRITPRSVCVSILLAQLARDVTSKSRCMPDFVRRLALNADAPAFLSADGHPVHRCKAVREPDAESDGGSAFSSCLLTRRT